MLGVYVYRSTKPLPVIKELQEAQAATAADMKTLKGKVHDVNISVAAIEETIRSDRQSSMVLDLKRSLVVLQEVAKQAPEAMKPRIRAIEEQLSRLTEEVAKRSPTKRLEIRSVQ